MSNRPIARILAGLSLPLGVAAISHSSTCHAQPVSPTASRPLTPGAATTATPPNASPSRLRLAFGASGNFWLSLTPTTGGGGFGIGGYARIGSQFTERFGLDVQLSGAGLVGWSLRGAVTVEYALADWFAVGTGVSVVNGAGGCLNLFGCPDRGTTTLVGVPLRIAFRIGDRPTGRARNAFEILVEGDLGVGANTRSYCSRTNSRGCDTWTLGSWFVLGGAVWLGLGYARF